MLSMYANLSVIDRKVISDHIGDGDDDGDDDDGDDGDDDDVDCTFTIAVCTRARIRS